LNAYAEAVVVFHEVGWLDVVAVVSVDRGALLFPVFDEAGYDLIDGPFTRIVNFVVNFYSFFTI